VLNCKRFGLLILLCLVLCPVKTGTAQEGRELFYGQVIQDTLNSSIDRQVYYFQARRGDVVSITMTPVSGNLDPVLYLADNSGNVLAASDDVNNTLGAAIRTLQIPEDNFYFIITTRFGHGLGVTEGTFELTLIREGVLSQPGVYLNYGDSVVGLVDDSAPVTEYIFEARRGDIVNVHMQRISGNLDTYVALSTEQGEVLAANDDRDDSLDAEIRDFLILDPGFYQIIASRFGQEAGTSRGSFVLTLETAPTSGLGLTPDSALLLRYGDESRGSINDDYPTQYYTFGAKRGDIVTLSLTRAGGDLDPLLTLLNPQRTPIAEDDDSGPSNNALLQSFIIPETGTYYVLATRFDGEAGTTAGDYIIQLEGATGEAPVVAPGTLTLLPGSTVFGRISDETPAVTYAFLANDGEIVSISMSESSGDLDPLLLLFTADSVELAQDDDSGPGNDARIVNFPIPADGIYYIVASRFELQGGATSGDYAITLIVQDPAEPS
jgi:hypothetical protein